MKEQLTFIDTPESGRRLPIEGRPFALVMEEMYNEGTFPRLVR